MKPNAMCKGEAIAGPESDKYGGCHHYLADDLGTRSILLYMELIGAMFTATLKQPCYAIESSFPP